MARDFVRASAQYLQLANAPVTAAPLSMSCWFIGNDISATEGMLLGVGNTGLVDDYFSLSRINDDLAFRVRTAATLATATHDNAVTARNWHHACGVTASSTSRYAYLDGAKGAHNTTSVVPSGVNLTRVGRRPTNGLSMEHDGKIAECAIWNVALDDAEVALLAAGTPAPLVRPDALVFYAPLEGLLSPEPDLTGRSGGLELVNAPAAFAHPPQVTGPHGVRWGSKVAAFTGTTVTPELPIHAPGDVLVAFGHKNDAAALSLSGWTAIATENNSNLSTGAWKKVATSSSESNPVITSSTSASATNGLYGTVLVADGSKYDDVIDPTWNGSPTTSTTPAGSTVTSTLADAVGVAVAFQDDAEVYASGLPPSGWALTGNRAAHGVAAPTITAGTLAAAATGTTVTAVLPSHQADDILVMVGACNAGSNLTCATSGWATIVASQNNANYSSAWFWKRAASGAETNPVLTSSTTLSTTIGGYATAFRIRGCVTTGDPFESATLNGTPTNSVSPATATMSTLGPNRLLVAIASIDDDPDFSSNWPASGFTTVTSQGSTVGGDHRIGVMSRTVPHASSQLGRLMGTLPGSDFWRTLALAFIPAAGGGGRITTIQKAQASPGDITGATVGTLSAAAYWKTLSLVLEGVPPPASPIVYKAVGTGSQTGAGDLVINYPATVNSGDLLIAVTGVVSTTDFGTNPAGWLDLGTVVVGGAMRGRFYYRVATGSEGGGTVTFPNASSQDKVGMIARYEGVNTGDIFDAGFDLTPVADSTSPYADAVTTVDANVKALFMMFIDGASAAPDPAFTERGGVRTDVTHTFGGDTVLIASGLIPTAGARAFDWSANQPANNARNAALLAVSVNPVIPGTNYLRTLPDSQAASDSIARIQAAFRTVPDSQATSRALTRIEASYRDLADSQGVSPALTRVAAAARRPRTAFVDAFSYSNGGLPSVSGGVWTGPIWEDEVRVTGSQAAASASPSTWEDASTAAGYGGDAAFQLTWAAAATEKHEQALYNDISVYPTGPRGYVIEWLTGTGWRLHRVDSGDFYVFMAQADGPTPQNGVVVRIEREGSATRLLIQQPGEGWRLVLSGSDGTYSGPWHGHMGASNNSVRWDDALIDAPLVAPSLDLLSSVHLPARLLADDAGAADSLARVAALNRSATDGAPSTDDLARVLAITRLIESDADSSDALDSLVVLSRLLSDSQDASSAFKPVVVALRTLADVAGSADELVRVVTAIRDISSAAGSDDALVTVSVLLRLLTDEQGAAAALERIVAAFRDLADAQAAASDLTSDHQVGLNERLLTDAQGSADSLARVLAAFRSMTDDADAEDSLTALLVISRLLEDAQGSADSLARVAVLARAVSDSAASEDALSRLLVLARLVEDEQTSASAVTRLLAALRALSDAAGSGSDLSRVWTGERTLADDAGSTSALDRLWGASRSLPDEQTSASALARVGAYVRGGADSAGSSDVLDGQIVIVRALADSAGSSDALSRVLSASRLLADSAPAGDLVARVASMLRTLSDAGASVSFLDRVAALDRLAADVQAAASALAIEKALGAILTDTQPSSDQISRTVAATRIVYDEQTSASAAARLVDAARVLSDDQPALSALASQPVLGRLLEDTQEAVSSATRLVEATRTIADAQGSVPELLRVAELARLLSDQVAAASELESRQRTLLASQAFARVSSRLDVLAAVSIRLALRAAVSYRIETLAASDAKRPERASVTARRSDTVDTTARR